MTTQQEKICIILMHSGEGKCTGLWPKAWVLFKWFLNQKQTYAKHITLLPHPVRGCGRQNKVDVITKTPVIITYILTVTVQGGGMKRMLNSRNKDIPSRSIHL